MPDQVTSIMSKIPPEAWLGILGVLVGAIISIFGVWLTNVSNSKQLRIQLLHEKISHENSIKRERLEELYVLVGHWLNGLASNYLSLSMVMQGKLDYGQHSDLAIKDGEKIKYDFNRLEMIMGIYAHELLPYYQKVIEARTELNKISIEHRHSYDQGDIEGSRFLKPYTAAQLVIEEHGGLLKEKIAKHAKNA